MLHPPPPPSSGSTELSRWHVTSLPGWRVAGQLPAWLHSLSALGGLAGSKLSESPPWKGQVTTAAHTPTTPASLQPAPCPPDFCELSWAVDPSRNFCRAVLCWDRGSASPCDNFGTFKIFSTPLLRENSRTIEFAHSVGFGAFVTNVQNQQAAVPQELVSLHMAGSPIPPLAQVALLPRGGGIAVGVSPRLCWPRSPPPSCPT